MKHKLNLSGDTEILNHAKSEMKKVFSDKAEDLFEVIWANQNLRGSLFGDIPLYQLDDFYDAKKVIFDNWIKTMDNNIFKFIKEE